ncbi:MAG: pyridoxine 5'-phosphate synthase [Desulfovibrionaceae bacterium]|nr:pyridoxine 5'-phosphate synthase [Desulfovibrionaceae bacterium]MBF0515267.1 pyridoxine 5'-phosphate synthase [Desulfovibrionaceae bacterium]
MPRLAVNVDHVATLRQARGGCEPDPVAAAHMCELAGARAIIVHLREDRRHIQDRDLALLRATVKTRLHLEMAATPEMGRIALETRPEMVCLVPEKRQELTTEGGLAVYAREDELSRFLAPLHKAGVKASLFIDPDPRQIAAAGRVGAEYIEIHTGAYADAKTPEDKAHEFEKVRGAVALGREHGLSVNVGHGLNYDNIFAFAKIGGIDEYSIGHAIVCRAVFTGLTEAVGAMARIVAGFPD